MKNNEDSAALTPEIARSLDAVDSVAPEDEQLRKQRLASWDNATVLIERIANRIVRIAGKAIGIVALAMLLFGFGNSESLINTLRYILAEPSGIVVPIAGIAFCWVERGSTAVRRMSSSLGRPNGPLRSYFVTLAEYR